MKRLHSQHFLKSWLKCGEDRYFEKEKKTCFKSRVNKTLKYLPHTKKFRNKSNKKKRKRKKDEKMNATVFETR